MDEKAVRAMAERLRSALDAKRGIEEPAQQLVTLILGERPVLRVAGGRTLITHTSQPHCAMEWPHPTDQCAWWWHVERKRRVDN